MVSRKPVRKGRAHVPVVMQMEAMECGAASLCMVMAYYGKWLSLEQVRKDCGVSRNGAKLSQVARVARENGLEAQGFRYDAEEVLTEAGFPSILLWDRNHFVVLCGRRGNRVYVNDPALGEVVLEKAQFERHYSDVCLCLSPRPDFKAERREPQLRQFMVDRLGDARKPILFMAATSVVITLLSLVMPYASRFFMDRVLDGGSTEAALILFAVLFVVGTAQLIFGIWRSVGQMRLFGRLAVNSNALFMQHIFRMSPDFYAQRDPGELQQRQQTNSTIANVMINQLIPLALDGVMLIIYAVFMVRESLFLACLGIAVVIVNAACTVHINKKRVNSIRVMRKDVGRLYSVVAVAAGGLDAIQASGAESGYFDRWARLQDSIAEQKIDYDMAIHVLGVLPKFLASLLSVAVLCIGVLFVARGEFTVGAILAFQGLLSGFTQPVQTVFNSMQNLQEMRTDVERVEDVMKYPTYDPFAPDEENPGVKLAGHIEFHDVTFGYGKAEPPVLEGLTLDIPAGSRIAIVGPSGCGKSTIANLLTGLYQPWSGELLFDGKPLSEIAKAQFKSSVASVDQSITLFRDTIENNIRMWDSSIEDFAVVLAARDAQIHDDIQMRNGGYTSVLAENGRDLSGGQMQRIEIARALAVDPTVLVMDEATSALDAQTEHQVMEAVRMRGITCVIIAHRISAIRDCDMIVVLDHGKVVEQGTHDELMALGGAYVKLTQGE